MVGRFIVAEGNEGAGKNVFLEEARAWAAQKNLRVFDLIEFGKREARLPTPEELEGYEVLISQEPSPAWTGCAIREEMVQRTRPYSGWQIAEAFSADRSVLYTRVIRPALERGMTVFSDRSVISSLVYQPITEPDAPTLEEVMALPGNALALCTKIEHALVFLVSPEEALKRIASRTEKNDNAIYDQLAYLKKIDERYRSPWLAELLAGKHTGMTLIDTTSTTVQNTHTRVSTLFASIL